MTSRQGVPAMTLSVPTSPALAGRLFSPSAAAHRLEYDLWQRYAAAGQILERMLSTSSGPVAILELGPNYLNPLPLLLDPERLCLTRADVHPVSTDRDFVQLPGDGPLPFANDAFAPVA